MPKPNGALIRSLRRKRGIKTGAFAAQVGISRQHMTAIEAHDHVASIEALERIAANLGVEVDELKANCSAVAP